MTVVDRALANGMVNVDREGSGSWGVLILGSHHDCHKAQDGCMQLVNVAGQQPLWQQEDRMDWYLGTRRGVGYYRLEVCAQQ